MCKVVDLWYTDIVLRLICLIILRLSSRIVVYYFFEIWFCFQLA